MRVPLIATHGRCSNKIALMRVAFVSIEDPGNLSAWSGTPHFMLQALRETEADVKVIAPLSQNAKYALAPVKLAARLNHRDLQLGRRPWMLRSYARQVERRLAEEPCDAILSTSSIPIAMLPPGIPVIFWTDAVFEAMEKYSWGAFRNYSEHDIPIAHRQEDAALHRASYAVYSSDWAAGKVHEFYHPPTEKIRVIRFGANLPIEHGAQDVAGWIASRLHQGCRLLFMGVNWDQKGGPTALEITQILRERGIPATLTVIGCEAPVAPYIENPGFISKSTREGRQKIAQHFKQATFFLLPTLAEAAGIVFCEASAFGLPILARNTGGVGSYVRNEVNGYCLGEKAPATDYADRIQGMLADPSLYRRLSLGAWEAFTTGLNWKSAVAQVMALLRDAIWQSPGRGDKLAASCPSPR